MEAFERLESLLVIQSYEELSTADQAWLREQGITRADYERQAEALRAATDLLKTDAAAPPAALRQRLLKQQQLGAKKLSSRRRLRIAGLVAALVLGLGLGWGFFAASLVPTPTQAIIGVSKEVRTIKDTVYLERTIYESVPPQVIYRDRIVYDTVFVTPVASVTQEELQREMLTVTQADEVTGFSRNAKETEQLLKLVVEVY